MCMHKHLLKVMVFALLVFATTQIHLKKHLDIANYIDNFKAKYQGLNWLLIDLGQNRQKILKEYSSQDSLDKKLKEVEPLFFKEISTLYQLERALIKPINQSQWACPKLSEKQKAQANQKIADTQQDILILATHVNNLTDTSQNLEVFKTLETIGSQLKQTSQALYAVGSNPLDIETPQVIYSTNMLDPNWFLTQSSLESLASNITSNEKQIVMCPQSTPYFDGSNCIKCEDPNIYFDIEKRVCSACINFNEKAHKCLDTYGSNFEKAGSRVLLPKGASISDYEGDIICSEDTPFYNGQECIQCQEPTSLFDLEKKECAQCQFNQFLNQTAHFCQRITKMFTNIADTASTDKIILLNNETLDDVRKEMTQLKTDYIVVQCPKDTPFLGQQQNCINCDGLFDYEGQQCGQCNSTTYYDQESHHCVPVPYYTNVQKGSDWVLTKKTEEDVLKEISVASQKKGAEKCSDSTPYFNGQECISCGSEQIFDIQNLKCIVCQQGYSFIETVHKCSQIYDKEHQTNPNIAPNLIYAKKSYNYWMREYYSHLVDNELLPDCPEESPYWSVKSCIVCPKSRPYFNMETQECQICGNGFKYNSQQHECVSEKGEIQG